MQHYFINIIDNTLNDNRICECFVNLEAIKDFSYIVVKNTDKPIKKNYSKFININESIKCTRDFFYSIDKKLGSMYENILQEKNDYNNIETTSVKFNHLPKDYIDFNRSVVTSDGSVVIDYSEVLYDIYLIVHEMTHKFSYQKNHNSKINDLLCEIPSITMELLLEDYLIKNTTYDKNEILINRNNELYRLYKNSIRFIYEYMVLDLYDKNGYISKNIIEDYIKKEFSDIKDKLLLEEKDILYTIKESNKLKFYKIQRYIIGTLFAINMNNKFNGDYSDLIGLIDILGDNDIDDIKKLNIINLKNIQNKIYINNSDFFLKNLEEKYNAFIDETRKKIKELKR